jgi:kynurenine formamidase
MTVRGSTSAHVVSNRVPPIYDISMPVRPGMLHWGRAPEVTVVESIANGDDGNVTRWLIGSHTGTHLDAPRHFDDAGGEVPTVGLDVLVGPTQVLDLTGIETEITAADLVDAGLGDDTRVLLKTRNCTTALRGTEKPAHWIGITADAADLLVERGVRLVGIDFVTIEAPSGEHTGWPAHIRLCGAGVSILEGADVADVPPGRYTMYCLPILLESEAAPARTILVRDLED